MYGVKVNIWRSSGDTILQKVVAQARANNPQVDVISFNALSMEALRREQLLQAVWSPYHKDLASSSLPSHRQWVSAYQLVFVQAYNTDKIKKEALPKTYSDLLDPKWKGKIGIEASDHEWVAAVIADLGYEKGSALFKALFNRNGMSVRKGHPLLTQMVASGEVPLALTVYQHSPEQLKLKGAPIDWFVIDSAVAIGNGTGVARRAPHPHAALLFYDYLLSPPAQELLIKIGYVPTNTNVSSPLAGVKIKYLDPALLLDEQEKSQSHFDSLMK
jgi:iron(III) transport system substrate-binding protein